MQSRIVLISDDTDFYEYIMPKLRLRKSDEVFRYSFSELPEKLHMLSSAMLIINSEERKEQTLELLKLLKDIPAIVFSYNPDEDFEISGYKSGMFAFITPESSDEEIDAKLIPALNYVSAMERNEIYRDMLVKNNLITENNEVFLDFTTMLDRELEKIRDTSSQAVLAAIAPNDRSKFLLQPNQIETIILNNIRKNDLLMNYATNKYFLLLYNINLDKAENLWKKIQTQITEPVYAGLATVGNKNREQIVNEVLNKLHTTMIGNSQANPSGATVSGSNFKYFRKEFNKHIKEIIIPVFYHIQQTYNDKLYNMKITQEAGDGHGELCIKSKYALADFKITTPGFSKINIDISYKSLSKKENKKLPESKRISLEPEEFEAGLLSDLLEQFVLEFKREVEE